MVLSLCILALLTELRGEQYLRFRLHLAGMVGTGREAATHVMVFVSVILASPPLLGSLLKVISETLYKRKAQGFTFNCDTSMNSLSSMFQVAL